MLYEVRHDAGRMRLPKPRSAPGLFLYALTALAAVVTGRVLWVIIGQNVENLSSDKGYDKLLSRHWSEVVGWMTQNIFWLSMTTAALVGGAIFCWIFAALSDREVRPVLQKVACDLVTLADEAARISDGINKILAEWYRRPPTHPDFDHKDGTERWQRENYSRGETAMRLYRTEWASLAWQTITKAAQYIQISEPDLWRLKHMSSDSDLDTMAIFLSDIAGRLRLLQPVMSAEGGATSRQ